MNGLRWCKLYAVISAQCALLSLFSECDIDDIGSLMSDFALKIAAKRWIQKALGLDFNNRSAFLSVYNFKFCFFAFLVASDFVLLYFAC